VPLDRDLLTTTKSLECSLKGGTTSDVRRVCADFQRAASKFYEVHECLIRVLAAGPLRIREHSATELFGDYNPETMLIQIWRRTAVRKEITSFGTFLTTLCHELDFSSREQPDLGRRWPSPALS